MSNTSLSSSHPMLILDTRAIYVYTNTVCIVLFLVWRFCDTRCVQYTVVIITLYSMLDFLLRVVFWKLTFCASLRHLSLVYKHLVYFLIMCNKLSVNNLCIYICKIYIVFKSSSAIFSIYTNKTASSVCVCSTVHLQLQEPYIGIYCRCSCPSILCTLPMSSQSIDGDDTSHLLQETSLHKIDVTVSVPRQQKLCKFSNGSNLNQNHNGAFSSVLLSLKLCKLTSQPLSRCFYKYSTYSIF